MLTIISCRNPGNLIFRNISNQSFQKCWQLYFPEVRGIICSEMLSIIFSEMLTTNISNYLFSKMTTNGNKLQFKEMIATMISRNTGDNCQQLYFSEIPAMNISYYNFQKRGEMLTIRKSRNVGDKCQQLWFSEMLTIDVNNHNLQKLWRQRLAIIFFRNDDDRC